DSTSAANAGAVYEYDAGTGALIQKIQKATPVAGDQFGSAVAVAGNKVAIGAPFAAGGGAVYLFDLAPGALTAVADPGHPPGDEFGFAVAAVGSNFLVGAPLDSTNAAQAGSAYLINGSTGAVLLTVRNPDPASGDQFGYAVGAVGSKLLVGAPLKNITPPTMSPAQTFTDAGAAYLFDGTSRALLQTYLDPNPTNTPTDHFGWSVAGVGTNAIIGAPLENIDNSGNTGVVYLFDTTSGALAHTYQNPMAGAGDQFGYALAVAGNDVL